ncbi:MAG: DUF86 domain-containing protein [Candidatus Melainabacteria bacterium]|nr:DUF86 domain-containing protein [Candidatus Melainabacteria bacterium]
MDDVLVNKAATIERCLKRIKEEYFGHEAELATNLNRQDSIILNLQRACEAAIDMGMRMVRLKQLGIPQSSRDIFVLLNDAGVIESALSIHLQAMVGFRNIAIHDYRKMNLDIVRHLIENRLQDLSQFAALALTIT